MRSNAAVKLWNYTVKVYISKKKALYTVSFVSPFKQKTTLTEQSLLPEYMNRFLFEKGSKY